jgi:hypothetical protein
MKDHYQTFWWCSDTIKSTSGTGWQTIWFDGPPYGGIDMPPVLWGQGWADPMSQMIKFVYVYLPSNSKLTGWNVANGT